MKALINNIIYKKDFDNILFDSQSHLTNTRDLTPETSINHMDSPHSIYKSFLDLLNENNGFVKILHRGVSKKMAFNCFNLDVKINTIEQFSEMFFFYGEKSKYFWNIKLGASKFDFDINETSESVFRYIFDLFHELVRNQHKPATIRYFEVNKEIATFFNELGNINLFLTAINHLNDNCKFKYRNYCLEILHQLGETKYNKNSLFISSTTKIKEAKKFSKDGVIINFWNVNLLKDETIFISLPVFKGPPYQNQAEDSIFPVILPHFIHSFEFENKIYINPALITTKDFEQALYFGFEINQCNYHVKRKAETNFHKGVEINGKECTVVI